MEPFSLLKIFFIVAMIVSMFSKSQKKKMKNQSKVPYDFNKEFSFKDLQEKLKNIRNKTSGIQNDEKEEILPGVKIILLICITAFFFFFFYLLTK